MLTIIHGDDIVSSRNFFIDQKQKFSDAVHFSGDTINLTDIIQVIDGGNLFRDEKNIFIEQLLTTKKRGAKSSSTSKKNNELYNILTYLDQQSTDNNIFMWENKVLDKSSLNLVKNATIKTFKLPQILFIFLDTLKPSNGKNLITSFHECLKTTELEMIFYMIVRHFRLMLAISEASENKIDEIKRLAPWQQSKLQKQAALFGNNTLINVYNKLFVLESGQKTGTLNCTMESAIDFLLLEL